WNVGRVLTRLEELKLTENTIVLYFSDNGPNSWRWNDGMKGRKGSTDEGGIRSPLLIRWPGHIPAGTQVKQIAGAIDLLPTLADRDGVPHGKVQRSASVPNCSYSTNWTSKDDAINGDVEVGQAGRYVAEVHYACPAADIGSTVELSLGAAKIQAKVAAAHDP